MYIYANVLTRCPGLLGTGTTAKSFLDPRAWDVLGALWLVLPVSWALFGASCLPPGAPFDRSGSIWA